MLFVKGIICYLFAHVIYVLKVLANITERKHEYFRLIIIIHIYRLSQFKIIIHFIINLSILYKSIIFIINIESDL